MIAALMRMVAMLVLLSLAGLRETPAFSCFLVCYAVPDVLLRYSAMPSRQNAIRMNRNITHPPPSLLRLHRAPFQAA